MSASRMRPEALAIVHDIPGRLRVRLPEPARTEGLAEAVGSVPGVTACTWSPRTRSVLIRFHADALTPESLLERLAAHTGVAQVDERHGPLTTNGDPPASIAAAVVDSVRDLDHGVRRLTGGRLNLALVMPLGLIVWAAFDVMRGPIRPLAWTSALWYAHGLFHDYALPDSKK